MTIEQLEAERKRLVVEIEKLRARKKDVVRKIYTKRFREENGISVETYYRHRRQKQ